MTGGNRHRGYDNQTRWGIFSDLYGRVRKKEHWLSPDAEVFLLPEVDASHPHYEEWALRKKSCRRLLTYLHIKGEFLNILEVGCGNGWLSARMAGIPSSHVTGIDVNAAELEQAMRVFRQQANLKFVQADIRDETLGKNRFNVIVFAASIQYFGDLKSTLRLAFEHLLTEDGEIHVLDSPLYTVQNIESARQRTEAYYAELGFPDMVQHYFHHLFTDIESFNYKILYNPARIFRRMFTPAHPFYWIRFKNR